VELGYGVSDDDVMPNDLISVISIHKGIFMIGINDDGSGEILNCDVGLPWCFRCSRISGTHLNWAGCTHLGSLLLA